MAKACPSSLAKISSSVLPGVFRLVHSPLLQGGALAAILDFLQALVLSKTSNLGYRYDGGGVGELCVANVPTTVETKKCLYGRQFSGGSLGLMITADVMFVML